MLSSVSFSLKDGEGLRITGPNGAGKTSLLRVIAGLAKPDAGDIISASSAVSTSEGRSQALYIGHLPGINARLTPLENLSWWLSLHGEPSSPVNQRLAREKACQQALFEVGLFEQQLMPCGQLSAGQQRRAALARLFLPSDWLANKRLWILDEPFTALDQSFTHHLGQQLLNHMQGGGGLLLTTHHDIQNLPLKELDVSQFAVAKSANVEREL